MQPFNTRAVVPARELINPVFGLQHRHEDIVAAIGFLFHGF